MPNSDWYHLKLACTSATPMTVHVRITATLLRYHRFSRIAYELRPFSPCDADGGERHRSCDRLPAATLLRRAEARRELYAPTVRTRRSGILRPSDRFPGTAARLRPAESARWRNASHR